LSLHWILFVLFFSAYSATAVEIIKRENRVAVTLIPSVLNKPTERPGPYNRILDTFPNIKPIYVPPGRAYKLLLDKRVDCIFPASLATLALRKDFLASEVLNTTQAYIFSKEPYLSMKEFEGKTIAIRRGFSFGNIRSRLKANYIELGSDKASIRFLSLGRVDGFIAYLLDAETTYKMMGIELDSYQVDEPVHKSEESFVCRKNEQNIEWLQGANRHINTIIKQ
jgi:ABC-type amino acid transport substrate-binding protein